MTKQESTREELPTPPKKPGRFMIVDDETMILNVWRQALGREGHNVVVFDNGLDALEYLQTESIDVAILDHMMPKLTGLELLKQIKSHWPDIEAIMMTGYASIETALEAMKTGAHDYLQKPFEQIQAAVHTAEKALERKQLIDRNKELEQRLEFTEHYQGMIGTSPKMKEVFNIIEQVAKFDATCMVYGETGTGKERVAKAIHNKSERSQAPFVAIVFNSIPENLLESTLFGYRKGAFTGANRDQIGLIESAHGGTLFIDEVGDMPLSVQVKLLRVLQEGEVQRVGDMKATKVDIRVVTATHKNMEEEVRAGRFREDLYFRLNLIEMELPPLRERIEDVPLLAHHFLRLNAEKYRKEVHRIDPEVIAVLQAYHWPGNVRQLEHTIARALIFESSDTLRIQSISKEVAQNTSELPAVQQTNFLTQLPFRDAKQRIVQQFERQYLQQLLVDNEDNISQAARVAEMDRANFRRLLKKHDLLPSARV